MDIIAPLPSILPVGSATSQGRERGHGQQLPATDKLLKAMVVEAMGNNRFVLEIGGNRLTASSDAKLTVGQVLQLQVTRTEPQIELKIVNTPCPPLSPDAPSPCLAKVSTFPRCSRRQRN